jgi:Holliday junction resolvase
MNPKKMLSKEIKSKFNGQITNKIISEKVDQFFRYGNTFLLVELINLRNEVKILRKQLEKKEEKKYKNSLNQLLVH